VRCAFTGPRADVCNSTREETCGVNMGCDPPIQAETIGFVFDDKRFGRAVGKPEALAVESPSLLVRNEIVTNETGPTTNKRAMSASEMLCGLNLASLTNFCGRRLGRVFGVGQSCNPRR